MHVHLQPYAYIVLALAFDYSNFFSHMHKINCHKPSSYSYFDLVNISKTQINFFNNRECGSLWPLSALTLLLAS